MNTEMSISKRALSGSWRKGVAISLMLSAVGCTSTSPVSNIDARLTTLPVEFQDYSGRPVEKGPEDAQLWLGPIPGDLYGSTKVEFKTLDIGRSAAVTVSMTDLERFFAVKAAVLSSRAAASGFTLTPSGTQLARVATSLVSDQPHWHAAGTNLADSVSQKNLVLVYFDRPCHLFGSVISHPAEGGPRKDHYDIVIEKAGLNWLEMTKVGEDLHLEVRIAPVTARPIVTVRAKQQ